MLTQDQINVLRFSEIQDYIKALIKAAKKAKPIIGSVCAGENPDTKMGQMRLKTYNDLSEAINSIEKLMKDFDAN